eukprot:snap_masked-scaffold_3-processed-gene-18.44-mRNA-1 protein AED:1.00 eAED:1.00 QI:0/0/0/0/1/1/2/0/63
MFNLTLTKNLNYEESKHPILGTWICKLLLLQKVAGHMCIGDHSMMNSKHWKASSEEPTGRELP